MKKTVIGIIAVCIALSFGCSVVGSKETKCKKAIEHSFDLMKDDPNMKAMGAAFLDKMIENEKKTIDKKISQCVADYDDNKVECVLSAKTLKALSECGK